LIGSSEILEFVQKSHSLSTGLEYLKYNSVVDKYKNKREHASAAITKMAVNCACINSGFSIKS
jgi:hypothetical protein